MPSTTSPKDKFEAAVKVIRGLPKHGSFQPSNEVLLKFYSYFKQATEGPCTAVKPGFWDLVNRKKWDAWSSLGTLEKEEAMLMYVDELKQVSAYVRETLYPPEIVETMPQTPSVTEFLQKLDSFYEMVEEKPEDEEDNDLCGDDDDGGGQGEREMPLCLTNGRVPVNGASGSEDSETETEQRHTQSRRDHSQMVNELLAHDMKAAKESPYKANGINGDHSFDVNDIDGETSTAQAMPSQIDIETDEEEEEEEAKQSASQSVSGSEEGESESEEFCDTSDEPVEVIPPPATSTPSKSVRFKPLDFPDNPGMSDSLAVNPPSLDNSLHEVSRVNGQSLLNGSSDTSHIDVTSCRGDDDDTDRRRRGQGSRSGRSGSGGDRGQDSGSGPPSSRSEGPPRSLDPPGGGGGRDPPRSGGAAVAGDLNEQIVVTLLRMQHDMGGVLSRLNSLEALVKGQRAEKEKKSRMSQAWWAVPELSVKSSLVIFVWPLVVHLLLSYLGRRKRKMP